MLEAEVDGFVGEVVVDEVVGLGLELDVDEDGPELVGAEEDDKMQLVPSHL